MAPSFSHPTEAICLLSGPLVRTGRLWEGIVPTLISASTFSMSQGGFLVSWPFLDKQLNLLFLTNLPWFGKQTAEAKNHCATWRLTGGNHFLKTQPKRGTVKPRANFSNLSRAETHTKLSPFVNTPRWILSAQCRFTKHGTSIAIFFFLFFYFEKASPSAAQAFLPRIQDPPPFAP